MVVAIATESIFNAAFVVEQRNFMFLLLVYLTNNVAIMTYKCLGSFFTSFRKQILSEVRKAKLLFSEQLHTDDRKTLKLFARKKSFIQALLAQLCWEAINTGPGT